jgi:hypothetical protein
VSRGVLRRLAGTSGILLATLLLISPADAAALSCAQAAAIAEAGAGLPPGLLLAIGNVESGRVDASGQRSPWPWTINAGGIGHFFETAEQAVLVTQGLRASGVQSIDIGCFQINLFHHPNAFPDLATGFDPLANAQAAARFLVSLHEELGAWEPAIAAYHSRVNTVSAPYRERVLAAWHGHPVPAGIELAGVHVWGPAFAGIHVWGPGGEISSGGRLSASASRSAPGVASRPQLPRVITAWVR